MFKLNIEYMLLKTIYLWSKCITFKSQCKVLTTALGNMAPAQNRFGLLGNTCSCSTRSLFGLTTWSGLGCTCTVKAKLFLFLDFLFTCYFFVSFKICYVHIECTYTWFIQLYYIIKLIFNIQNILFTIITELILFLFNISLKKHFTILSTCEVKLVRIHNASGTSGSRRDLQSDVTCCWATAILWVDVDNADV